MQFCAKIPTRAGALPPLVGTMAASASPSCSPGWTVPIWPPAVRHESSGTAAARRRQPAASAPGRKAEKAGENVNAL
jgi:hypothetical protein